MEVAPSVQIEAMHTKINLEIIPHVHQKLKPHHYKNDNHMLRLLIATIRYLCSKPADCIAEVYIVIYIATTNSFMTPQC